MLFIVILDHDMFEEQCQVDPGIRNKQQTQYEYDCTFTCTQ